MQLKKWIFWCAALALLLACISPTIAADSKPEVVGEVLTVEKLGDGNWSSLRANVRIKVLESTTLPDLVGKEIVIKLNEEGRVLEKGDTVGLVQCSATESAYFCYMVPVINSK
jgi:hypothetical protein